MDDRYKIMVAGFVVAMGMVGVGAVALGFANETLDVIARLFGAPEWETWFPPLSNYEIPGFGGNTVATFLLGVAFTGVVLVLTFVVMRLVTRRTKSSTEERPKDSARLMMC
jgi:hypothetical protein